VNQLAVACTPDVVAKGNLPKSAEELREANERRFAVRV